MAESDHDERRRAIAHVTMGLIAREGLEAATVRRIAAEVGYSTTIVTHYFTDKQELLLWAYRTIDEWARERFERAMAQQPVDLVGYLMSMCAVDEVDKVNWRPLLGIWDRALRDPAFATELHGWIDTTVARLAAIVRSRDPDCADPNSVAKRLLAMVQGVSLQLLFDRDSWTDAAVREAFTSEVELLVPLRS
jgi:TetR/AcrR family transcriptional regulator, transcriptional repressor of bet genes